MQHHDHHYHQKQQQQKCTTSGGMNSCVRANSNKRKRSLSELEYPHQQHQQQLQQRQQDEEHCFWDDSHRTAESTTTTTTTSSIIQELAHQEDTIVHIDHNVQQRMVVPQPKRMKLLSTSSSTTASKHSNLAAFLFEVMPVDTLLRILEFYEFPLYSYWPRFYHKGDDGDDDDDDDNESESSDEEEDTDNDEETATIQHREIQKVLAGTQLADMAAHSELIKLLYGYFPSRIAQNHDNSSRGTSNYRQIYFLFPCLSVHDYSISMALVREPYFMLQLINSVIRIRNIKVIDLSGWQHSELNLYDPSRPSTVRWNIHQIKSDDQKLDRVDNEREKFQIESVDFRPNNWLTRDASSSGSIHVDNDVRQHIFIQLYYNGILLDHFPFSSGNTIRSLYSRATSVLKRISSSYISYDKRPFRLIQISKDRLLNPEVDECFDALRPNTTEIIHLEFDCNMVMDSLKGLEMHSVYDDDDNDLNRAHLFIRCAPKLKVVRMDYTKEETFGPSLKTLRISSYDASASQFSSFVNRCPNITELTLRGSTLNADSLQHLAHLHHLKRMNIASEACKEPIRLPISPHLVSLKLSDGITLDEETSVAVVRDNRLTELKFLFGSGLHERAFDYFEQNTSLLRIISNMETFWVKGIERIVRNRTIQTVKIIIPGNKYVEDVFYRSDNPLIRNLTYLKMSYESVMNEEIADALLAKTRNLTRITIGTNSYVCSRSTHKIVTQLPKLERLKLMHTHVDDSVNHALFQDLRLQVLQLYACSLTTDSLASLRENWTLKRLVMRHNRIDDLGACSIVQNCRALEMLDIANNCLTANFLPLLKQYNRTIRWIRLGVLKGLKRHACDVVKEFSEIQHFEVLPDRDADIP